MPIQLQKNPNNLFSTVLASTYVITGNHSILKYFLILCVNKAKNLIKEGTSLYFLFKPLDVSLATLRP